MKDDKKLVGCVHNQEELEIAKGLICQDCVQKEIQKTRTECEKEMEKMVSRAKRVVADQRWNARLRERKRIREKMKKCEFVRCCEKGNGCLEQVFEVIGGKK